MKLKKMGWITKSTAVKRLLAIAGILSFASAAGVYAAETKIEGVLFGNYSLYTSQYKTANALAYDYNAFDIGRIYVTASTKYSPNIASKIVLEGATTTAGNAIFLKNAFLQWKNDTGSLTVEGGMPGTLWIGAEEAVWKYRFVEKVQTDLEGILKSADKGVKVIYKLPKGYGSAEAMLANGEGYNALETTNYRNKVTKDGQARLVLVPFQSFKKLSFSGHFLGGVGYSKIREKYVGGVAYEGKKFSLGASMFKSIDFSTITATTAATVKTGYSIYGNLPLNANWSFFSRLDVVDNSVLTSKNYDKKTMLFAGIVRELAKDVKLALTERRTTQGQITARRRDQNIISLDLYAKY